MGLAALSAGERAHPLVRGALWAREQPGVRRVGIVALARRLLVELWRYLETGAIPEGAVLKTRLI